LGFKGNTTNGKMPKRKPTEVKRRLKLVQISFVSPARKNVQHGYQLHGQETFNFKCVRIKRGEKYPWRCLGCGRGGGKRDKNPKGFKESNTKTRKS